MIERERFGRIDSESEEEGDSKQVDIGEYLNQEYNSGNEELPVSMEFEHPNLKKAFG